MQKNATQFQSFTSKHPLFNHLSHKEGEDLGRRAKQKLIMFASMALVLSLSVYFY